MKAEHELTDAERDRAWMVVYDALHFGDPKARPILMDQRVLIEIVADLLARFAPLERTQ